METITNLPTKVKALAEFLNKNEIPYTLQIDKKDDHDTYYKFKSVQGRWFQSSIVTVFVARQGHTTSHGTRKNSSQFHLYTTINQNSGSEELYEVKNLDTYWSVHAVRSVE